MGGPSYFNSLEGIEIVRVFMLQMCTTKFKELKMHRDEAFDSFITKLTDTVNETFQI